MPGTQNILLSVTHSFVHSVLNTGPGWNLGLSEMGHIQVGWGEVGPYDKPREAGNEPGIPVWDLSGSRLGMCWLVPLTFTPPCFLGPLETSSS